MCGWSARVCDLVVEGRPHSRVAVTTDLACDPRWPPTTTGNSGSSVVASVVMVVEAPASVTVGSVALGSVVLTADPVGAVSAVSAESLHEAPTSATAQAIVSLSREGGIAVLPWV